MKDVLQTRKYDGETYTFHMNEMISWATNESVKYITCETPENCFGYRDTVMYDRGVAYTLHRHLQPWILRKIKTQIERLMDVYL